MKIYVVTQLGSFEERDPVRAFYTHSAAVAWRDRQIEEWRTESQKPGNWMMRIPYLTADCFDIHETDLEES